MGIRVRWATAEAVVFAGLVEGVAVEMALVEVQMTPVIQAKVRAAGEHQRQVGVTVAVAVGHAAAEERHS